MPIYTGFESIKQVQDIFIFKKDDKYGLANASSKVVVLEPVYSAMEVLITEEKHPTQGLELPITLVKCQKEGKWAVGTLGGDLLFDYDAILLEKKNTIPCQKGGKWGTLSFWGATMLPCIYDSLDVLENGVGVQSNGKWGVVNFQNEQVLPTKYDKVWTLDTATYMVLHGGRYQLMKKDSVFSEFKGRDLLILNENLFVFETEGGVTKLMNREGDTILTNKGDLDFKQLADNNTLIKINNKWGGLSANGTKWILPIYDSIQTINNTYFGLKDGEWGFIINDSFVVDHYGFMENEMKAAKIPDSLFVVPNGLLSVNANSDNRWGGYRSKVGLLDLVSYDWAFPPLLEAVQAFQEEKVYALVYNYTAKIDNQEGILRPALSSAPYYYHFIPKEYHVSNPILASTSCLGLQENAKFFLLDKHGKKLSEPIYNGVGFSINDKGYMALLKGDKWGCMDAKGNEILGFEYEKIQILPNGIIECIIANNQVKYWYEGKELPSLVGDYFATIGIEKTRTAQRHVSKF